ncbi:MAG: hypothetical protein EOO52_16460 [Gammaproteobacteria bacterium]|nr:MAG: hypothetical protein EOO52_16460 [Gammaproteobacteria bacterium]
MNENKSGHKNKTENNANKAALYSAIIFPGAGLWWLKHYARACIFIVPTCIALWYITTKLYDGVAPVYKQLQRQAAEGLIDITNITGIYTKLSTEIHNSLAAQQGQLATVEIILVACWLCSIVSSYFVGKKMDLDSVNNTR